MCRDKFHDIKEYPCYMCGKIYGYNYNLTQHLKNNPKCNPSGSIAIAKKKKSNNQNIVNNNNVLVNNLNQTINQVVNKILFVEHGKEKIDHITREILLEILDTNNFNNMCSNLMRLLYFNVAVPQNSNWMIAYPKNHKAGVAFNYFTNKFERTSTVDIIDDKFSNMINLLQPLIEKICREDERDNILNAKQRRNISRFFEHVGMMQISKESPEVYERIHDMAYNHRSISTTSWKEQGFDGKHLSIQF